MGGGTQRTDGERKHMDAKGMVYIDGRNVAASEVDPARHRFLGMFREPGIPSEGRGPKCRCGMLLVRYPMTQVRGLSLGVRLSSACGPFQGTAPETLAMRCRVGAAPLRGRCVI